MDAAAADKGLILKDGTKLPNCEAGWTEHGIWVYLAGMTVKETWAIFSDAEKISEIRFVYGKMEDRFYGYTQPGILLEGRDGIRMRITGEETRAEFGQESPGFEESEQAAP